MKKVVLLFVFGFLLISCSHRKPSLSNTTWVYNCGDCQDYISFREDSTYVAFFCETGDTISGKYSDAGEFIILNQEYGYFDDDFQEGTGHKVGTATYELILVNGKYLGYSQNWDAENKKWKVDYYLTKE